MSPKKCEPFKLPRAGTVGEFEGGFVPAEFKKQQAERRTQATGTQSCQRYDTNAIDDEERQSEKIMEQEQVLSILERLPRIRENDPKLEMKQNSRMRIERVGISHDVNEPRGAVVNARIGGTHVEVLLDTGATTDLIRTDVARRMVETPTMERYAGRLETADGQVMAVDGVVTTRFKLGDIDEDIEALVVPKLKAEMVLGLRSMKEYQCSLMFSRGEDFLWTGTREGSMVPIRHVNQRYSPERMPSLPHDPGGRIKGKDIPRTDMRKRLIAKITAAVESPDEILEGWPTSYDDHSVNVVQENEAEEDEMYGCPKPVSLDEALGLTRGGGRSERVAVVQETKMGDEDDGDAIRWERTKEEIATMQKEDEAIAQVFYWAETADETSDMPSLGTNLIPKGQAIQYGPEALAYWSRWDELSIRGGILYKKWFQRDGSKPTLLTVVPAAGRKEILGRFDSMETGGGQLATEKMLAKIRRRYWWPTMRTDVERKVQWCLSQGAHNVSGKRKRAAVQAPFDPGIRFNTVAVDVLGPMTMATQTKARHVLVMTDLFTMYAITVPLVSTDASDVAQAIVEHWVLKFGTPNALRTDQGKVFGSELIKTMCRLLGIDITATLPYKPEGRELTGRYNDKMAKVISKYCAENPKTWDTMLPYLGFVYNTTTHRTTGATPFSLVHGQECQYPIDLFYAKPHDEVLTKDGFAEELDELFRDAHSSARELVGTDQRRQEDQYWKKVCGEPYTAGDKVWVWAKEKFKSKKHFDPWEGPYVVLARMSEVNYKVAKESTPSKVKFLHFNKLKRVKEETIQSEEATASKRPAPYRSVNFFDDPEMRDEDELLWQNNREGFSHDPGPRDGPVRLLPVRNRAEEPPVNPPGRNVRNRVMPEHFADPPRMREVARREEDAIETYDATELEARREEEPANLPSEEEGIPPGDAVEAEPVMDNGTADDGGRPTRVRRQPVRFGIDNFVS